jgi:hypothetical protein
MPARSKSLTECRAHQQREFAVAGGGLRCPLAARRSGSSAAHRPSLAREITIVLAVKLIALGGLYFAFFGPSHRIAADAAQTAQVLLSGTSVMRNK